MNKEEENRLSNTIIDLHQEIKGLRKEMKQQLAKVNAGLGEMRTSYIKLGARVEKLDESFNDMCSDMKAMRSDMKAMRFGFNKYAQRNDDRANNQEIRIVRLEESSGSSYVAEPKAKYSTSSWKASKKQKRSSK